MGQIGDDAWTDLFAWLALVARANDFRPRISQFKVRFLQLVTWRWLLQQGLHKVLPTA